jgi:hypothetical protein
MLFFVFMYAHRIDLSVVLTVKNTLLRVDELNFVNQS